MVSLSQVKITYAKHENYGFISIHDEVVVRGLSCNCICIECGGRLVAKKKDRAHHFAHYGKREKDYNCNWTGESELHLRVKSFLQNEKKIKIPIGHTQPYMKEVYFSEIALEAPLRPSKLIPDVKAFTLDGEQIIFEIRVTHEVDLKKKNEYKKLNVTAIEILFDNLGYLIDSEQIISDESIKKHLLSNPFKWLSIAPSGTIAELYHQHERDQLQKLIIETKKEREIRYAELSTLKKQIYDKQNFIRTFDEKYTLLKKMEDKRKNSIAYLEKQIHNLTLEKNEVIERNKAFINQELNEFYQRLSDENNLYRDDLNKKNEEFRKDIIEIELSKIQEEIIYGEKTITDLKSKIKITDSMLNMKKDELRNITELHEKYSIDLDSIQQEYHKSEDEIEENKALIKWARKKTQEIATIEKNFHRLENDIRPLCRKWGIPWPYEQGLLQEFQKELKQELDDNKKSSLQLKK